MPRSVVALVLWQQRRSKCRPQGELLAGRRRDGYAGAESWQMKSTYFRTLFNCIVGSFGLLIFASVAASRGMPLDRWVAVVLALAPLVYYHLFYLLPRAKQGLSQGAIDSVYYFGFLITVAALGVSAISVATS